MEHIRTPQSSQIYSHAHADGVLEIKFNCRACAAQGCDKCSDGTGWKGHYAYDAPESAYAAMLSHQKDGKQSVGSGFAAHIRKAGFKYRKLA